MIYKYDTQPINGKDYIIGSRRISEKGRPTGEYEFPYAFTEPLTDENGKLQWTIRIEEGRYIIERDPVPLTSEEIAQKKEREKLATLRAQYPQEKVIAILDRAIQALARGEGLPQEYQEYTAYKENLEAGEESK